MNTIYWLWLSLKRRISTAKALRLIFFFKSVKAVYEATEKDYKKCTFLTAAEVVLLTDKRLKKAEEEMDKAIGIGVEIITYDSIYYPEELRFISNPPLLFYAAGDLKVLQGEGKFCIVGTRDATAYGVSTAMQIAQSLAEGGIAIVSGMAVGIDTAAHRGAIKSGGKTIAILGCGIDVDYPAGSGDIKRQIYKNGVIISEFPFGTPAYGKNFPYRNRVLSAMSLGTLAVEGSLRSGSLITAQYALEQGKDVYALPGNITNPQSAGPNALIRDGAIPVLKVTDILENYIVKYPHLFGISETMVYRKIKSSTENVSDTFSVAAERVKEYEVKPAADNLSAEETAVLKAIGDTKTNIDEIIVKSGLSVMEVNKCVVKLQLSGKITEHPGRHYTLK